MDLTILIIIVFIFTISLVLQTPLNNYNLKLSWIVKIIAVYLAFLLFFLSMFINNSLINKYLTPLIIYINILMIAIIMLEEFSYDYLKIILLLGFLYILITFDYKRWEIRKGIFTNPDKKIIVLQAIVLTFWYILADNKNINKSYSRIVFIIIVLLPFIFPLKYYGYYRIIILAPIVAIGNRYFAVKN